MDVFCNSLEELIEKSRANGNEYFPMSYWDLSGTERKSAFTWWAGDKHLILVDGNNTNVNVDINIEEIKNQILDEIGISKDQQEEYEIVNETYINGHLYQLVKQEMSQDEFSARNKFKRKRSSKNGNHAGDERGESWAVQGEA